MRNPVGASHPAAEPTAGHDVEPLAQNHLPTALRDYAEDLLSGTGIDVATILGFPLTGSPTGHPLPQELDGDRDGDHNSDLASALWAGWSAAARHAVPTSPTQLTLPDPDGDDQ